MLLSFLGVYIAKILLEKLSYIKIRASSCSTSGSVSILNNLKDVGSITAPFSYDETLRTKDNYENTYVEISWNDNIGKPHTEKFDLNIIDEIIIFDDEQ